VLDPDVVLRNETIDALAIVRGAAAVASGAVLFQQRAVSARPVLVNGVAGVAASIDGEPYSIAVFTVVDDRIVAIDIFTDPARLRAVGA
jgi:hypothetical protein